jgi:hypothetical protein
VIFRRIAPSGNFRLTLSVEQRFSRPLRGNFENLVRSFAENFTQGDVHCQPLSVKSLETAHLE